MGKSNGANLMAIALAATTANIVKGRGSSGRLTYLDRFVNQLLTGEPGEEVPTEPKERLEVIAGMTLDICLEKREAEMAADPDVAPFTLTKERNTADDELFAEINVKVKHQVAAAIANNNNSTSVSYNEKYKDAWHVVKNGSKVSLAPGPDPAL